MSELGLIDEDKQALRRSLLSGQAVRSSFTIVLQGAKYSNILFSILAGAVHFYLGNYQAVKEYMQICFLAIIVSIIDSDPGYLRVFHFLLLVLINVVWNGVAVYTQTLSYPPFTTFCLLLCALSYTLGSAACAYVIVSRPATRELPRIKFMDLDLLVYLIALNVLCIIPTDNYNLSLHMILDIRMLVLLYTGLYRPADKIELLHDKSFVLVLLAIIFFFVLYTLSIDYIMYSVAYLVNVTIGLVLLYQAHFHYYERYPALLVAYQSLPDDLSRAAILEEGLTFNAI